MSPFPLNNRDLTLLLIGAATMYLWTVVFSSFGDIIVNAHFDQLPMDLYVKKRPVDQSPTPNFSPSIVLMTSHVTTTLREIRTVATTATATATATTTTTATSTTTVVSPTPTPMVNLSSSIPETEIVQHAPGWTVFRNLYMAHGTLYIVTADKSSFPAIRLMTSTGLAAENVPGNEESREPTSEDMDFLTPDEARSLWGADPEVGETANRILSVEGNTWLLNDPSQFLRHYYHLVGELIFGAWAFWTGTFVTPSYDIAWQYTHAYPASPKVDRIIFVHSDFDGWRDGPGFDVYFMRAAMPSVTIEHEDGWQDRIDLTSIPAGLGSRAHQRAWHFPIVMLTDRSAAFRGPVCGGRTQRTAAEAWEHMIGLGRLPGLAVGGWWTPIRSAIWRYAGVRLEDNLWPKVDEGPPGSSDAAVLALTELVVPERIVVTYVSRQGGGRRKLVQEDHEGLVEALRGLVREKGERWELQVLEAERMTKDEQVRAIARSTVLLGVHGNGLTHLVLMAPTRVSTVIEMFYPGGFAHDYQWTTHALGMRHYAVWNDSYYTVPNKPQVNYPEGFQGNSIPVHGPAVAKLIEDRVEGRLQPHPLFRSDGYRSSNYKV